MSALVLTNPSGNPEVWQLDDLTKPSSAYLRDTILPVDGFSGISNSYSIAFNGTTPWIVGISAGSINHSFYRLNPVTFDIEERFVTSIFNPRTLSFINGVAWVTNNQQRLYEIPDVTNSQTRIDHGTGYGSGGSYSDDNGSLWLVSSSSGTVYKIDDPSISTIISKAITNSAPLISVRGIGILNGDAYMSRANNLYRIDDIDSYSDGDIATVVEVGDYPEGFSNSSAIASKGANEPVYALGGRILWRFDDPTSLSIGIQVGLLPSGRSYNGLAFDDNEILWAVSSGGLTKINDLDNPSNASFYGPFPGTLTIPQALVFKNGVALVVENQELHKITNPEDPENTTTKVGDISNTLNVAGAALDNQGALIVVETRRTVHRISDPLNSSLQTLIGILDSDTEVPEGLTRRGDEFWLLSSHELFEITDLTSLALINHGNLPTDLSPASGIFTFITYVDISLSIETPLPAISIQLDSYSPVPPLMLSDWDNSGFIDPPIVLALIVAEISPAINITDDPPQTVGDADLIVGSDLSVSQVRRQTDGRITLRKIGAAGLEDYFDDTGTYSNACLFIQTLAGRAKYTEERSGSSFSHWIYDSGDSDILENIVESDRFILAIVQEEIVYTDTSISIDTPLPTITVRVEDYVQNYTNVNVILETPIPTANISVVQHDIARIIQTIVIDGSTIFADDTQLLVNLSQLIDTRLVVNGAQAYLRQLYVRPNSTNRLRTSEQSSGSASASGPQLIELFEIEPLAIQLVANGNSVFISGPDAPGSEQQDNTEPYEWRNAAQDDAAILNFLSNYNGEDITVHLRADIPVLYQDIFLSIESPLPTVTLAVSSIETQYQNIAVSIQSPLPFISLTVDSVTTIYQSIILTIETPLPTIRITAEDTIPQYENIDFSIENTPPTISIKVTETGAFSGKYIWLAQRNILGSPGVGSTVSDNWGEPIRIGLPSIDGRDGSDANGYEFIFARVAVADIVVVNNRNTLVASKYPNNSWGYDTPGISDGLQWHDSAPLYDTDTPYLFLSLRITEGSPAVGDQVAGVWSVPGIIGEKGESGISLEYAFSAYTGSQLPQNLRPLNSWGYNQRGTVNGLDWSATTVETTESDPFSYLSTRLVIGSPADGVAIDDNWSIPVTISHYGIDGQAGKDGRGLEYIYTNYATNIIPVNRYPLNSWPYEQPGTVNGQVWTDGATEPTAGNRFLIQSIRRVEGSPTAGDIVLNNWRPPVAISYRGRDGIDGGQGPQGDPGEGLESDPPNNPVLTARADGHTIIITWDYQENLFNLVGTRVQVAEGPNGPWYAPDLTGSGINWRTGSVNGYALVAGHSLSHVAIPLTPDATESRTLYYRVRREVTNSNTGGLSNVAGATAKLILAEDIADEQIGARKILAGTLQTLIAEVVNYMTIGDLDAAAGLVLGAGGQANNLFRSYLDRDEVAIQRNFSGVWRNMLKLTVTNIGLEIPSGAINPTASRPALILYERNSAGAVTDFVQLNGEILEFYGRGAGANTGDGRTQLKKDELILQRYTGSSWRDALTLYQETSGGGTGGHLDIFDQNGNIRVNLEPDGLDLVDDAGIDWIRTSGGIVNARLRLSSDSRRLELDHAQLDLQQGITLAGERHSDSDMSSNAVYDLLSPSCVTNLVNVVASGGVLLEANQSITVSYIDRQSSNSIRIRGLDMGSDISVRQRTFIDGSSSIGWYGSSILF